MEGLENCRICTKTVMDTIADPDITFDEQGVSHYYHLFQERKRKFMREGEEGKRALEEHFAKIKKEGEGKPYDCITGVSGGVDSTYMVYLAKQYGLRPLVIHLDNGWNSEIANQNINNIIDKCGYELHTHVIDWEEFKDIQKSFLKASVVDLELTSDHAIFSVIYRLARKYKIKYMLSGFNVATEGILPNAWRWTKFDWLNIKAIQDQFGSVKIKTFPHLTFAEKIYYDKVLKLETIQPLNFIDYDKEEAKKVISAELGWQDYGGKHFESIITRFYQGFILPHKFGIDKRKAHLSSIICSGKITREEALEELKKPIYDSEQQAEDREFVLKKFGFTEEEFEQIMQEPVVPHDHYPSYVTKHYEQHKKFFERISPLTRTVKKVLGVKRQNLEY